MTYYWIEAISPETGIAGKKFKVMGFHENSDYDNAPEPCYGGDRCYNVSEEEYRVLRVVKGDMVLLKKIFNYLDQHFCNE